MSAPGHYQTPLRSRAAITEFIAQDWRGYYSRHENFALAWDVKAYAVDILTKPEDFGLEARFDDAWAAYCEEDIEMFWRACEDAASYYLEGLYCSYPGTDQGDYEFTLCGRSGGHLCLVSWRGWSLENRNYCNREDFLAEFCVGLTFPELRDFYKAIVCMDHDLTPAKASEEVSYHIAGYRESWEIDLRDNETLRARDLEATRPDMYEGGEV